METIRNPAKVDQMALDRISALSDPLAHHILSFLPTKDAARTAIVSKRWEALWLTSPILDFDETYFYHSPRDQRLCRSRFLSHMQKSLAQRLDDLKHVSKLRVSTHLRHDDELDRFVDRLLALAIIGKVRELDLNLKNYSLKQHYVLPEIILSSGSSLVSLMLVDCYIGKSDCIDLISLKNLTLRSVDISEETLFKLVESCRFLENLKVESCKGLETLKIINPSLKCVIVSCCKCLNALQIDIRACRFLKSLKLHGTNVTDQWLEDNLPQFPFVEDLILSACNLLKKIKISDNHEGLKSFELLACTNLEEAEIHARNLCSFTYIGDLLPSNLLIISSFLHANLFLHTELNPPKNEWFERLRDFIGFFDHCKVLRLVCESKILLIPKELRESLLPPLFDVKHLKVETISSTESLKMLVESLLWLSPLPETISIFSGNSEKLLKFQYAKAPVAEKDYKICCRDRLMKCWKHSINKVTMENFDDLEKKLLSKFFEKNAMRLESICDNGTP